MVFIKVEKAYDVKKKSFERLCRRKAFVLPIFGLSNIFMMVLKLACGRMMRSQ